MGAWTQGSRLHLGGQLAVLKDLDRVEYREQSTCFFAARSLLELALSGNYRGLQRYLKMKKCRILPYC